MRQSTIFPSCLISKSLSSQKPTSTPPGRLFPLTYASVTTIIMLVVTACLTPVLLGSLWQQAFWLFIFVFPGNEQMNECVKHLAQFLGHKIYQCIFSPPIWYLNMLSCVVIIVRTSYLFHWILSSLELRACLSHFFFFKLLSLSHTFFNSFFFFNLLIYLFIFGCVRSSFLREGFL